MIILDEVGSDTGIRESFRLVRFHKEAAFISEHFRLN
jgi:hypothetical protein